MKGNFQMRPAYGLSKNRNRLFRITEMINTFAKTLAIGLFVWSCINAVVTRPCGEHCGTTYGIYDQDGDGLLRKPMRFATKETS